MKKCPTQSRKGVKWQHPLASPKINTRKEHGSVTNAIAKRGQGATPLAPPYNRKEHNYENTFSQ